MGHDYSFPTLYLYDKRQCGADAGERSMNHSSMVDAKMRTAITADSKDGTNEIPKPEAKLSQALHRQWQINGGDTLERLVTVSDMRSRYGCSAPTARKYLRQMFHYESPLTAPLWALQEWEKSREAVPSGMRRTQVHTHERERIVVPRKRG